MKSWASDSSNPQQTKRAGPQPQGLILLKKRNCRQQKQQHFLYQRKRTDENYRNKEKAENKTKQNHRLIFDFSPTGLVLKTFFKYVGICDSHILPNI